MIKVFELGPFGCTIYRGRVASLEEIPDDYSVKHVVPSLDEIVALIEPIRKQKSEPNTYQLNKQKSHTLREVKQANSPTFT